METLCAISIENMRIPTKYTICSICKENGKLTYEHVIPSSIGGTLELQIQCKDCNSNLGSELVSQARKDPIIRSLADKLKDELPELYLRVHQTILWVQNNLVYWLQKGLEPWKTKNFTVIFWGLQSPGS